MPRQVGSDWRRGGTEMAARHPEPIPRVAVSDSSPHGPIKRDTPSGGEQGRGLQIVEALSARWGWRPEDGGKVVFAVIAREA